MKKHIFLLLIITLLFSVLSPLASASSEDKLIKMKINVDTWSNYETISDLEESDYQKEFLEEGYTVFYVPEEESKSIFDSFIEEFDKEVEKEFKDGTMSPYFKGFERNKDFSEIIITVDESQKGEWDGLSLLFMYSFPYEILMFSGKDVDDIDYTINLIDYNTEEIISTSTYKEVFESLSDSLIQINTP